MCADSGPVHLLYLDAVDGGYQRALSLGRAISQCDFSVSDSMETAQSLFAKAHETYTETELRYLQHRSAERSNSQSQGPMSADDASALLSWHSDALRRCESFMIQGFERAEVAQKLAQEFLLMEFRGRIKWPLAKACPDKEKVRASADLKKAPQVLVSQFISGPLQAVGAATNHMHLLDNHLRDRCAHLLEDAPNAYAAVQDDALGLAKEVEEECAKTFEATVSALWVLVEKVWANEQRKSDFKPANSSDSSLEPTAACKRVTSLLSATKRELAASVDTANAASFGSLVAHGFASRLKTHVFKFGYSMAGGLRLKRDLNEYIATVKAFSGSAPAVQTMESFAEACNLLVVQQSSVQSMLSSGFSIGATQAEEIAQLRFN